MLSRGSEKPWVGREDTLGAEFFIYKNSMKIVRFDDAYASEILHFIRRKQTYIRS